MAFSDEQQQRIVKAIRDKGGGGDCPICKHNAWILPGDPILLVLQPNLPNRILGGPGLPTIPIVCSTCGYTQLFNLIQLGVGDLIPSPPAKADASG